mgnify:CR=1 FL=1
MISCIENKSKIIVIFITFVLVVLSIYLYSLLNTDLIYKGVKIDRFDVSLMTRDEAFRLIRSNKEKDKHKTVKLTYFDREFNIPLKDLGLEFEYEKAIEEAYKIGREGNVFIRIYDIIRIRIKGVKVELGISYDKDKIKDIVDAISMEINVEPRDAQININDGNIEIINEVVGREVQKDRLIDKIEKSIYKLDVIQIPVESIIPKVTGDLLSRINGIIGEFSTSFKGSSKNRIENIRLSANAIKGTLLMPGEAISFNEITGPREQKFGYKEANVIINGEFTPGIGGGVCQTSTTLYNALLLADVTILERSPHSIPPNYVNFGKDAAVAYGYLDLKFRNDFDYPIYIDAEIVGDRLFFYIYGDAKERDFTVKVESEIVEVIEPKEETIFDKTLEPGNKVLVQEGRTGYKVNTYKYIIKNGQIINKELITQDHYRAKNYVYKVGEGPYGEEDYE